MADDACQAQANVSAGQSRSLRILHRLYTLVIAWKRSLFSKIIIAFLGVGLFSYSLGALVGWSMFVEAAKEQWNNQARTNLQIASSTLRGVYTYVVIRTDEDGHVERIVTAQPIGDDDSILFTGFTPTDVLALVAAQTNHDAWLFRHDAQTGQFFPVAASSGLAPSQAPWISNEEDLFTGKALAGSVSTGFATIDGESYFIGVLPIVSPDDVVLGAVAVSIGKATVLKRSQQKLLSNSLVVMLTILLLTGLIATFFARSLFRPVPALVQATRQISREVTDKITPFQNRSDEIGEMARAIEALREAVVERAKLREIRDMAIELEHMAHHDTLTGLANRALLMKTLETALDDIGDTAGFNILLLDLDRFKVVNDTLGHGSGDRLLIAAAERITALLDEHDLAARLGGDEFAIIQRVRTDSASEARALGARLLQTIAAGFILDGHEIIVGTSIGVACAPSHGASAGQLLQNADLALYRAKAAGRGNLVVYEHGMDMVVQDQHALEIDLRLALQRGEFELHYQPFVKISTGEISGFEALVRWRHPQHGLIAPDRFIPLAEETGGIVPLGAWVLERACTDASKWPATMRLAVNLSPVQLRNGRILETVQAALAASGLDATRLELEVTETVMLAGSESRDALNAIAALGASVVLDDFGTGYASLSYLADMPFSKIKIDRGFVADLPTHPTSRAIVGAITNLARELDMEITAEGVETEEQLLILKAAGCTNAQGFYFARPRPLSDIELPTRPQKLQRAST
ncbi:EAL domain-containing protein (plasmid) [Rhizobium sp. WL3]|uniref:putative bifunctional diguanylate cyclase/phosphodiesterase n=1 Tax=Rhizobium sp. WL3 TaxID=2603277 RepID=UPI0011C1D81C|nr:EAL domain-containing protein [Rhizobium sp. WL3]QEE43283.1 EAL domain-containing protein [Rhizobium sp. WL3]